MTVVPGEFGVLDLGEPFNGTEHEFSYPHHVICLSHDLGRVAFFIPLTTSLKNPIYKMNSILLPSQVTGKNCLALYSQLKTLDYKKRGYKKLGEIPLSMLAVLQSNIITLLKQNPPQPSKTQGTQKKAS